MGGINSLSGLNKVNVDFRPTVSLDGQNKVDANQPQAAQNNAPGGEQPVKGNAKSVVRQLDVLLLNAAGKSVKADAAKNVKSVGDLMVRKGVLTQEELDNLKNLANDAAGKLKALDAFSGRELAKALVLNDNELDYAGDAGEAVKDAIEAQEKLSEELGKFNDRLASHKKVDAALQDRFTELQFQCDRRATEISSIVIRMYDLVQQDVVDGAVADPQTAALLDATFTELMPREAIMMHGTAEAFEKINETLGDKLRPLAQKLDAFAADGSKVLSKTEIKALQTDMALMKNAIANVRKNGVEIRRDNQVVSRIEVDKSLLDEMDKIIADAKRQLDNAKKLSVERTVDAALKEIRDSLYPENLPGGGNVRPDNIDMFNFNSARRDFMAALDDFAKGKIKAKRFEADIDDCIGRFTGIGLNTPSLLQWGYEENAAKGLLKTVRRLNIVKEQFKELLRSSQQQKGASDLGIATSDVRRIMLGEVGLSNVVEAKIRGFKPGDVDPSAEAPNIASSKHLGSGAAGKTYLLKTNSGGELVFKPDLDSRIGLDTMVLSAGGNYKSSQNTANLNLASQDTAKAFGCEDLVVKYSVGSHDGQFGFFMEKAKGFTGEEILRKKKSEGEGVAPAALRGITDAAERAKIQGQIAKKLNKLMWLDLITGQGDRHWNNYFIHIDKTTHEVTVKAIDNDASFGSRQVGLQKYTLNAAKAKSFIDELKDECDKVHGDDGEDEYDKRVSKDPAITHNADGTVTVDLMKAESPEVKMALNQILGTQSIAVPEEMDKEFFDMLMKMKPGSADRQNFLDSIKPRISEEAFKATEARLDEAIRYAEKLEKDGKVYDDAQWHDPKTLSQMPKLKSSVEITKSDGSKITVKSKNLGFVQSYCIVNCPSYYKRDFLDRMF